MRRDLLRPLASTIGCAIALTAGALPNFAPATPYTPIVPSDGRPLGSSCCLQVVDVDGDGRDDLLDVRAITNAGATEWRIRTFLKRTGAFVEGPTLDLATGWSVESETLFVLRVDGDALPDLVFLSQGPETPPGPPPTSVTVARGVGGGAFAPPVALAVAASYYGTLEPVDLDADGDPDLLYNAGLDSVTTFMNDAGTYSLGTTLVLRQLGGLERAVVASVRVDADAFPDLLLRLSDGARTVELRRGLGDGAFAAAATPPAPLGSGLLTVDEVDLGNDGRIDLLMIEHVAADDTAAYDLVLLRRNADGSLTATGRLAARASPDQTLASTTGRFVDLEGDGAPEFVRVTGTYGDWGVPDQFYFQILDVRPDGTLAHGPAFNTALGAFAVLFGDLDDDGRRDALQAVSGAFRLQRGVTTPNAPPQVTDIEMTAVWHGSGGAVGGPRGWVASMPLPLSDADGNRLSYRIVTPPTLPGASVRTNLGDPPWVSYSIDAVAWARTDEFELEFTDHAGGTVRMKATVAFEERGGGGASDLVLLLGLAALAAGRRRGVRIV